MVVIDENEKKQISRFNHLGYDALVNITKVTEGSWTAY
jgi:hypothetical protein